MQFNKQSSFNTCIFNLERKNGGFFLYSVHFLDSLMGWAVGSAGIILHTSDGGKTWEKQESCTKDFLFCVHFVDSEKGWAVGSGGAIIRISDENYNL